MARIDAWTRAEDDLLCEEWGLWPDSDIAEWLGRSVKACEQRATILGVRKRDNRTREGAPLREAVKARARYVGPETRRGWYARKVA